MFKISSKVEAEDSITISKDIAEVFDFVALNFVDAYPQWSPEVDEAISLSNGPMQVGHKILHRRDENGDVIETVLVVKVLQPNTQFCYEGVSEPYAGDYTLEASSDGSGTHLRFKFHLDEIEVAMRPFVKLIRTAMEEGVTQTLKNIKRLMEMKA